MGRAGTGAEKIFLRGDNGAEINFTGRLYSEISYYAEETASLTRLRLFALEDGGQVYSIVSGAGLQKSRTFYTVSRDGEMYRISNGVQSFVLPLDLLFASVFGLCGIDPERAEDFKSDFEENLRKLA